MPWRGDLQYNGHKDGQIQSKSLVGDRVILDRLAMATKWDKDNHKVTWQCMGKATCGELFKEADKALERAKKQEAAATRLKIMEDCRDRLINLAKTVQEEVDNRNQEELIKLGNNILNKGKMQSMA